MDTEPANLSMSIFDRGKPFIDRARSVYHYQIENNPVYKIFATHFVPVGKAPDTITDFPVLPIRAFKEANLIVKGRSPELTFRSSGTGSMVRSQHHVADLDLYRRSILQGFSRYFNTEDYTLLCYAPGYSDNPDSSLLWMMEYIVGLDKKGLSRFLPLDKPLLDKDILEASKGGREIILFGAAFGLLDLIDMNSFKLPENSQIIETGGMKTYRRDMTKPELRDRLSEGFGIPLEAIHSEYGMCELMSQLYAIGSEWFDAPHWVHASVRDAEDPQKICKPGEEGKVAIIDLANMYSCPFILTEDRGVMNDDGLIAVLGRWQGATLRGCNFLIDSE